MFFVPLPDSQQQNSAHEETYLRKDDDHDICLQHAWTEVLSRKLGPQQNLRSVAPAGDWRAPKFELESSISNGLALFWVKKLLAFCHYMVALSYHTLITVLPSKPVMELLGFVLDYLLSTGWSCHIQ